MGEKVINCQLSFYPLQREDVNREVDRVIEMIQSAPVQSEVNQMSTIISGEPGPVFELLEKITLEMDGSGLYFAMSLNISNYCPGKE